MAVVNMEIFAMLMFITNSNDKILMEKKMD